MAQFLAVVLALLLNVSSVSSPRLGGSIQAADGHQTYYVVDCTHQAWASAAADGNKALEDKYISCQTAEGAVLVYHFTGNAPVADRIEYDWVDDQP